MPARRERAGQGKRRREEGDVEEPGANAATANRLLALSAAMPRAAVPMKKMYGKDDARQRDGALELIRAARGSRRRRAP